MNSEPAPPKPETKPSPEAPASRPPFPFSIVLCVWLLVAFTVTMLTFILPETFASTARLRVERDQTDVAGISAPKTDVAYDPYFIQTEFEIIRSELVLGMVINDLKLHSEWSNRYHRQLKRAECLAILKRQIEIKPFRSTSIIEITAFGPKPEEAAQIANAIAEAYRNYRFERRTELLKGGIKALAAVYNDNEAKIRAVRAEMTQLARDQANQDSNRLDEAKRSLEDLQRLDHEVSAKMDGARTDLSLPASSMVTIVDIATPNPKPIRPNKPFIIALGILAGGLAGLLLAGFAYAMRRRVVWRM